MVSPATNRIGRQNKYLNISTKAKDMSLEKYFIIATIEVPKTISKNRNSTPKKYESLGYTYTLFKLLPRTLECFYTSKCPTIKFVFFFFN